MYKKPATGLQNSEGKSNTGRKPKKLPEYLEVAEVESLIEAAPNAHARISMYLQWRGGLRIAEAIAITPADVTLKSDPPELKVRQGKNSKDRIVPLHPQLAEALKNAIEIWNGRASDSIVGVTRQAAWRWYKEALRACYAAGTIPEGKPCGTHTLRHSAARHWLLSGTPINVVSQWLGHSSLGTTMIYLQLMSDPGGFMEKVP